MFLDRREDKRFEIEFWQLFRSFNLWIQLSFNITQSNWRSCSKMVLKMQPHNKPRSTVTVRSVVKWVSTALGHHVLFWRFGQGCSYGFGNSANWNMDNSGSRGRLTTVVYVMVFSQHFSGHIPYEHNWCSSAKFSHVSHARFTCFAARWQTNQDWLEIDAI
jgi:hypothetical protein